MDLGNNYHVATTTVAIVLGNNGYDAKTSGWKFDKKQDFYIVQKYLSQDLSITNGGKKLLSSIGTL